MFKKVLIANRGEIALRIIRACKELGIETVAVHSDVDEQSLHVKLADESVCIGPAESRQSYLSIPKILSAAEITNADAIHPGYGFLAENAEFANVCKQCGVTFIGPDADQIKLMGDKIQARSAMAKAGLSMLPSIEFDVFDYAKLRGEINEIGFPLIVKASAGGGGKGIKVVESEENLEKAVRSAQSEAKAAFGDGTIFIEKYLEKAKHIEYQVVGGPTHVVHLGERDCSIQRRHQKILEEAPCVAISDDVRKSMGEIVVKAMNFVGYQNVGTVEFLMDEKKNFYFLEMNTRIQVEHPITEAITGIDLVKLQIQLAGGEELSLQQEDIAFSGHALEMRITAEDPEKLLPSCGTIEFLHVPGGPGIRVDNGIYEGFEVTPYYDSLLGKITAHGATRNEAIARAQAALDEYRVEGIQTNIPLHRKILKEQEFLSGETYTRYLDKLLKL